MKKLTAWLLTFACLCCLLPAAATSFAEGESNRVYIVPDLGDGATLEEGVLDDLYVVGSLSADKKTFTYTESRMLSFTVTLEEGWSYSTAYSQVFRGDEEHVTVTGVGQDITVTYDAVAGVKIPFASLCSVGIYTEAKELPKMYLTISGDWEDVTKETWVDAEMNLQLGTKAFVSGNFIGACQVKGRGNMSWGKDQKPYSINFEKKTSLLDFPEIKKYCIVTNASDGSYLRNLITYQAYQKLDGIGYVVHAELVKVYLNGDYGGIYTLSERLRISANQVQDVAADAENVTGGYLVEKSVTGKKDDNDVYFKAPYHGHSDSEDIVLFKDPDEPNAEMIAYTKGIIDKMHAAIASDSQTAYLDYVDTASWAEFLIVQEVAKNIDGELKTSCFMYIPSESQTVQFASPWDFDLAYNNDGSANNNGNWTYPDGTSLRVRDSTNTDDPKGWMLLTDNCPWFKKLYNNKPAFKRAVQETYTKYRYTVLQDLYRITYRYAAYLGEYADDDEIRIITDWLDDRLAWLDTQWLLTDYDAPACNINVTAYGDVLITSPDGDNASAAFGKSKFLTFTPAQGFTLGQVLFNGRDVTKELSKGTYTTPYMTGDCEIVVALSSDSLTYGGHITGHGETIDNFTVTLSQDGKKKYSVTSKGDTYTFTGVKSGTYTLTIAKAGYVPDENTVSIFIDSDTKSNVLFLKGDCTLDGAVTADDITLLASHLARIETIEKKKARGAVTLTGDKLSSSDLTLLAKFVAGIVKTLD